MEQGHKSHKNPQSGPSTKKKDKKDKKKRGLSDDKHNPKAFTFKSVLKAKKQQAMAAEKDQRKLHMPTIDCSVGEPAPFVTVVHGPLEVGKSLVIKSLVKHYTKHNPSEVRGPITVVSASSKGFLLNFYGRIIRNPIQHDLQSPKSIVHKQYIGEDFAATSAITVPVGAAVAIAMASVGFGASACCWRMQQKK